MGDAEGVARDAVQEIALDGFGRRVGNGVNEAVEAIPALAEFDEYIVDLLVAADIEGDGDVAAKLGSELLDAVFEALGLVGEGEFRAFTVAGLGDAIGDGVLGQQTGDQDFLAGEKAHLMFSQEV